MNVFINYIKQRFPAHLLILLTTVVALSVQSVLVGKYSLMNTIIFSSIFLLFLLHLRFLDEIKDHDFDSKHHKNRPVQKGEVTLKTIKLLAIINIVLILVISLYSYYSYIVFATLLYSFLMFKEFFIKELYRKSALLYLISHQIVFLILLTYFFSEVKEKLVIPGSENMWLYLFFFIPLVIMEIGRKMDYRYSTDGEKTEDSYAKVWGEKRAIFVFFFLAVINSVIGYVFVGGTAYFIIGMLSMILLLLAYSERIRIMIRRYNMELTIIYTLIFSIISLLQ